MARYLSLEEVAEVLGTTERTVRRMLNDGRLPGSQTKEKGKMVWRVHATKELLEKLEHAYGMSAITVDSFSVEDESSSDDETDSNTDSTVQVDWTEQERDKARAVAEEFMRPLVERIENQAIAIAESQRIIADQQRRLRLLPDLEKRAEAERKEAELHAFEAEYLKKQVAAIESEKQALEEKLQSEQTRLQLEKETEVAFMKVEVERLVVEVETLKKPWWKRMFDAGDSGKKP